VRVVLHHIPRTGRLPIGTIGLGTTSDASRNRSPGRHRRSRPSQRLHMRDGDHEPRSPFTRVGELFENLFEILRKDQDAPRGA
jgi:hypothetical protein